MNAPMAHTIAYTAFNETDEIRDRRRTWLIAKESQGPLDPGTLAAMTLMLQEWLAHMGLPSTEEAAKAWARQYALEVMSQQLHTTAKLGSIDPDIVGSLGTDDLGDLILSNTGTCSKCGEPVFWGRVVRKDGVSGGKAPFDLEPAPVGEFHLTTRADEEGRHIAAHRWGPDGTKIRYAIHFDTCREASNA